MTHHCHARNCKTPCPRRMLMCRKHWSMVPRDIQDEVYRTYREGQCDDMRPSQAWHQAADKAILAVAVKEGLLTREKADEILERKAAWWKQFEDRRPANSGESEGGA